MITNDLDYLTSAMVGRGDYGIHNPRNAWPTAGPDVIIYMLPSTAGAILQQGHNLGDTSEIWVRVRDRFGVWGPWTMLSGAVPPGTYVLVAGDTMTGPLQLPAANPTLPTQAAHKAYVDSRGGVPTGGTQGQALVINNTGQPTWGAPIDGANY